MADLLVIAASNEDVAEIRRLRAAGTRNMDLAATFGTSRQNITLITAGTRRRDG